MYFQQYVSIIRSFSCPGLLNLSFDVNDVYAVLKLQSLLMKVLHISYIQSLKFVYCLWSLLNETSWRENWPSLYKETVFKTLEVINTHQIVLEQYCLVKRKKVKRTEKRKINLGKDIAFKCQQVLRFTKKPAKLITTAVRMFAVIG